MVHLKYILVLIISFVCCSCHYFTGKDEPQEDKKELKPLARVYDQYIYDTDIDGIVIQDTEQVDSVYMIQRYLQSWIRKQLLIAEAKKNIAIDESAIERKVLDYRFALIAHEYKAYYINKNLERKVSEQEIMEYYEENIDNFQLKQNIVKAIFIQIPLQAPKIKRFKKLLKSKKKKDQEEFKSYCYRFAKSFNFEDSVWLNFEDLVRGTPLFEIPDKVRFLKSHKEYETSDEDFFYYLIIKEYKISDEVSPLNFVKEDIKQIIINKRKVLLANKLEKEIFNQAKQNQAFEVYEYE